MIRVSLVGVVLLSFAAVGGLVYSDVNERVYSLSTQPIDGHLGRAKEVIDLKLQMAGREITDRAQVIAQSEKLRGFLTRPIKTAQDETTVSSGNTEKDTKAGNTNKGDLKGGAPADVPQDEKTGTTIAQEDPLLVRHKDMWQELQGIDGGLQDQATTAKNQGKVDPLPMAPKIIQVVDKDGLSIADTVDGLRYNTDEKKASLALRQTLKTGQTHVDIRFEGEIHVLIAVAPILDTEGGILGAVILGYAMDNDWADADRDQVQADVAYLASGEIRNSSSLAPAGEKKLNTLLVAALKDTSDDSGILEFDLDGDMYQALWWRSKGYASNQLVPAILLNRSQAEKNGTSGLFLIVILLAIGGVVAIGGVLLIFSAYDGRIRALDKGVLEIINGDEDYWFEIPGAGVASTMAQNLNIMVCQLSGRPLPDEEDGQITPTHWAKDQMFVESIADEELAPDGSVSSNMDTGQLASISESMVSLVRDDEETYKRRLYQEYVAALKKTEQPYEGLTYALFSTQLNQHAKILQDKHGFTKVRFTVIVEAGKATLKPIPIR